MQLCDDWCTVDDVLAEAGPCCGDPPDPDKVAVAIPLASTILWGLTGYRFGGICERTVRPCARSQHGRPAWPRTSWPVGTRWVESWGECSCQRGRQCGCNRLSEITLGAYPVVDIIEVVIDGIILDPSAYRLDEQRWLVRTDGEVWPCCQNLAEPLTEPDTWGVTFTFGELPEAATTAAALYACQLARAWCGQECELPSRVQSITRQGVTATFADPTRLTLDGLTGVPLVDQWIRAVNGGTRPPSPMLIASPDIGRRVRDVSPATPGGS